MTVALHACGLSKLFPSRGGGDTIVLDGVDLTLRRGNLLAVESVPGAGRSTLARCLYGTYRADAGTILLQAGREEVDLTAASDRTLAWWRAAHLSFCDGRIVAPPRATAAAVVARAGGISLDEAALELSLLGLLAVAAVPVGQLRPNEARLVALTATLAQARDVLILDDPLAGLDDRHAAAVLRGVESRCEDGAAVLATSIPGGHLRPAASRTVRLASGRLTWQASASKA